MNRKVLILIIISLLIIYFLIPQPEEKKKSVVKTIKENETEEMRGIFISYIELNNYIKNKDELESKKNIDQMIKNIKTNHFNTIFLQVRSHADSIYESNIFPTSKSIILSDNTHYDVLKYFIDKTKKEKINLYAWVNPYRIGPTVDKSSKYYQMVGEEAIENINNTYYFNPANPKVESLIVKGIEEIVAKYKIKGIIFDDYFYPSNDIDLDYYKNSKTEKSITEYRLDIVTSLIENVNKSIQVTDNGISPGSGIGNKRKEISKETLNTKVISVGIPTVIDASTIVSDTINYMVKNYAYNKNHINDKSNKFIKGSVNYLNKETKITPADRKNFLGLVGALSDNEIKKLLYEVLTPIGYNLMVTPKEVDFILSKLSDVISYGINHSIHNI